MTQAIKSGQYSAPKTVLGFLGGIALIVAALASVAIVTFASSSDLHWLLIPVLLFVALGSVALVWAVLRLAREDPTPLVLGEMTGGDYIAHRKLTKGDSTSGEYIELPSTTPSGDPEDIEEPPIPGAGPAELPTGEDDR